MEETPVMRKMSNGAIFKKKHGYSKTQKRLMQKHGPTSLEELRDRTKARKKKQTEKRKDKRAIARANRKPAGAIKQKKAK